MNSVIWASVNATPAMYSLAGKNPKIRGGHSIRYKAIFVIPPVEISGMPIPEKQGFHWKL